MAIRIPRNAQHCTGRQAGCVSGPALRPWRGAAASRLAGERIATPACALVRNDRLGGAAPFDGVRRFRKPGGGLSPAGRPRDAAGCAGKCGYNLRYYILGGAEMQKKIPMRQCMGCRERKPKRELIRVVRSPEGVVSLDFKGKAPGRGAYVCPNPECLKKAVRSKALERNLEVPIPQELLARLAEEMEESHEA